MDAFGLVEIAIMVLAGINGFVMLVSPVSRFHARLDVLEARLAAIDALLAELRDKAYDGRA